MGGEPELHRFYEANIHDRRLAAKVFRAFPLVLFITLCSLLLIGMFANLTLLLVLCAVMNVAMWLWLTATTMIGIFGTFHVERELAKDDTQVAPNEQAQLGTDSVMHLIVFPNYKEEEAILAETLRSLQEAEDSHLFQVVLAMEAREEGSDQKAENLRQQFAGSFAQIEVVMHPADLTQAHIDGSASPEIPGKASNVKWAIRESYRRLEKDGQLSLTSVMVTVSDADCVFHPRYFSHISREFNVMRSENPGKQHEWTMWQAPQLSFRDHWRAPLCSRAWTYISSMYEFGGVSGLQLGGHHMVFSSYSLPLKLAYQSGSFAWDGDIIAEDHHCYLKSYFYSVYEAAKQALDDQSGCDPLLQVRPVFLPVKSTPVISSEGYWNSYVERWHQGKRHCQGVAELPYAMLATYDLLCTLPIRAYSFKLFVGLIKVFARLFCMHLLPIFQAVGLGLMTLYWLVHGQQVPSCPSPFIEFKWSLWDTNLLCGLAGAWTLIWPVVIPMFLLILSNYFFVTSSFLNPAKSNPCSTKVWYQEDGGYVSRCGSKKFSAFCLTVFDCCVCLFPNLFVYAGLAMVLAYWNVAFHGNDIVYVSASKQTRATAGYGSVDDTGDNKA